MAIQQKGFIFFANFSETIKNLPEEKQASAYKALCEFGIYGILPEDETLKIMCLMVKESIFKNDKRQLNGGNHNPTGKNQYSTEEKTEEDRSIQVNSGQFRSIGQSLYKEKEKEKEKEKVYKEKKIDHPTLEEVLEYAKQQNEIAGMGGFRCSKKTAESFWSNYEANGWVVNNDCKTPILNWKAKLRQWAGKESFFSAKNDDIIIPKQAIGDK